MGRVNDKYLTTYTLVFSEYLISPNLLNSKKLKIVIILWTLQTDGCLKDSGSYKLLKTYLRMTFEQFGQLVLDLRVRVFCQNSHLLIISVFIIKTDR